MICPKIVSKHLANLRASGYGEYICRSANLQLGSGVYEICLHGSVLSIFEKGLVVRSSVCRVVLFYSEILGFTTHLSAEVFSKASESRNVNVSIPLEIVFSEGVVVVDVYLLVYSRLLIALNDLWRVSNKCS